MGERMDDRPANTDAEGHAGPPEDARQLLAAAYDACAVGLFRYAAMLLGDPHAAEDAVHQAFAKLLSRDAGLGEIEAVAAYLRSAVRNECYRMLGRRKLREDRSVAAALLEAAPQSEPPPSGELLGALERGLRSLPPEQREIVHMKTYERMTFAQIAGALSISINTAASRYRYALERLRKYLGPLAEELQ